MSISVQGLRTCIYRVSDIEKATIWYSKALGIEPYFNEPFYVGFNVAGYELGLQPEESTTPKGPSVITYWGVRDVAKTYQALLAMGATAFEEPAEVGGGIVVAAVQDPWNNIFAIIHNPHFTL